MIFGLVPRSLLDAAHAERDAWRDAFRDMAARYHELRLSGADAPAPAVTPVLSDPFGPLTRAALADASVGQSGPVIRGMRTKASALLVEHRGADNADEIVAIAVRNGEVARR